MSTMIAIPERGIYLASRSPRRRELLAQPALEVGVTAVDPVGMEQAKKVLPELAQNRVFINRFLDEAKVSARLSPPNIVQILELGERLREAAAVAQEHPDAHVPGR